MAGTSLVIWFAAFCYCSSLCLLQCSPLFQAAEVEYTHEGCEGHPADSGDNGCSNAFCDAADTAYFVADEFQFVPPCVTISARIDVPLDRIRADNLFLRQPIPADWISKPVVCLDTANLSLAPPASSLQG